MSASEPLNFKTIADTIKSMITLGVSVGTVMTVIGSFLWVGVLEPRVRPYLQALETLNEITTRLSAVEGRLPPLYLVEYRDTIEVDPVIIKPGGDVTVTYYLRHNFSCEATVRVRFYSVDRHAYDVGLSYERPAIFPPISATFEPFSIDIKIPDNIRPGRWAYAPEFRPDPTCIATATIYPPPAYITVSED